ncbi:MAG: hypothetical protein IH795_12005 [Bacteroidetes bacterium]|nr:hypothetical protein [Bacteroidota bacterium]
MLIEEYVNGAELQIQRIERTRKLANKSFNNVNNINWNRYRNQHLKIFCDAHFYFICIGQVNKCLETLCKELKNKRLSKVKSEFKNTFSQEIRNDLEHINERAVGKKYGKSIGVIRDFKNFANDNLTFNGKKYPVNKKSLNKSKLIYKNIISVIHEEYALKDQNFVNSMNRNKHINKIKRIAEKEYLKYLHAK